MNEQEWQHYERLCSGANRAIEAIEAADWEILLATLGMAMTTALMMLPPEDRVVSAIRWMQRLAASLMVEGDGDGRSVH